MCSFALLGGQKTSQYLVWPPFSSHLLHIELITLLIVACGMFIHSSSVVVQSCWTLAGNGTRCCIHIVYVSYPDHPKHAQWMTCPVSMLAIQELATIKGHPKMFSFITQHNATDVAILRERAIGMLTAGMSTIAVARELNVHFSTVSRLQRRFRQFGSPSNRPHNRRPCVTTPAQDLHIQQVHLQDRLRWTVRNHLREDHLHAHRPHWGLDLTAVSRRNRLQWANAHIWWCLARWRGVLFTDESRFSLFRADDRQRVWRCVGEQFADVSIVDRVAHGGGGVMVWAGVCYGQRTQVHFIDGILNAQRYRDEILRPIVVPLIHDIHLMLQHDNTQPHVARICTQFQEAENIPVLAWPAYSPDMSPIEHVWDGLDTTLIWYIYDGVFQFLPISSNSAQPLKRSG